MNLGKFLKDLKWQRFIDKWVNDVKDDKNWASSAENWGITISSRIKCRNTDVSRKLVGVIIWKVD